jgi:hypothetical protein
MLFLLNNQPRKIVRGKYMVRLGRIIKWTSPLLVLARNEATESYLKFSCGRDQQLTLTSNIHFHCVHPGKIVAPNNVEQVLAKNSCRMRVEVVGHARQYFRNFNESSFMRAKTNNGGKLRKQLIICGRLHIDTQHDKSAINFHFFTLTSNIHFHCVHPGKIVAPNNVEQVLAKNSCRMRVEVVGHARQYFRNFNESSFMRAKTNNGGKLFFVPDWDALPFE